MQSGDYNKQFREGMRIALAKDAEIEASLPPQAKDESQLQFARRVYAEKRAFWNQDKPSVAKVSNISVNTQHGEINCRLYYNGTEESPVLFYQHGGGFVVGNLDTHERIARLHASHAKCNVITLDYGKSPEHKFPIALNQIIDVLKYFYDNAKSFKLNPDKFCLSGDSAGAQLSLSAMIYLRDKKSPLKIACALLYYGAYGMGDSHSIRQYGHQEYGLSWQLMEWYKNHYLENQQQSFDPLFNLLLNDMHNLPPLFILAATFDPLCDDSRILTEKVNQADGICKYSEYRGVLHGFLHYSKVLADAELAILEGCAFMHTHTTQYAI